jgi:glycosyltransferase involved in cell wall biosynthesis
MNSRVKNPRILMLIENLSFPMDRRMRQEAGALRDAGYEVTVICPRGGRYDRKLFEIVEGVRVYRYPLWQASGWIGYLVEYSWAMLCTWSLMFGIWVSRGFDYVHAANPPDLFFLLFWPYAWLGKKFIYDQHDLCPETYETKFHRQDAFYRLLLLLERWSYRMASLVIAPNQSFYDIARTRGGVPEERLAIVRSGPDVSYFKKQEPCLQLKQGFSHMVAYLGVMSVQDGVDRVVKAAHHLHSLRGRRDVLFVLIGNGDYWQKLKELAREFDLDGSLRFTGRIPDDELLAYLSTADVCVAPDPPIRLNHLSTMNKIMEYMACGSPIVSFDLIESRRSAGSCAVYVEQDDPLLLATAIDGLLHDEARRRSMGQAGVRRVANELSWQHSAAKLVAAYSRLEQNERLSRQAAAS